MGVALRVLVLSGRSPLSSIAYLRVVWEINRYYGKRRVILKCAVDWQSKHDDQVHKHQVVMASLIGRKFNITREV
jgi:hypothetical protein